MPHFAPLSFLGALLFYTFFDNTKQKEVPGVAIYKVFSIENCSLEGFIRLFHLISIRGYLRTISTLLRSSSSSFEFEESLFRLFWTFFQEYHVNKKNDWLKAPCIPYLSINLFSHSVSLMNTVLKCGLSLSLTVATNRSKTQLISKL